MSISSLADKTVTVKRPAIATSPSGAYEETYSIWKRWKVRIQPLNASELVKLGREATEVGIRL